MPLETDASSPGLPESGPRTVALGPGAVLLGGFAVAMEAELLAGLDGVLGSSPFRHMVTPGGFPMSVAMSNCGTVGWVSDRTGYRYDQNDPEPRRPWPDALSHRCLPTRGRRLEWGSASKQQKCSGSAQPDGAQCLAAERLDQSRSPRPRPSCRNGQPRESGAPRPRLRCTL